MKTVILLMFFLTFLMKSQSQSNRSSSMNLELGKNGLVLGLAFDHKITEKPWGYRAFIGSNFSEYRRCINGGLGGYRLFGSSYSKFELGFDISYMVIEESYSDQRGIIGALVFPAEDQRSLYSTLNIGYRHIGEKVLFRCGLAPGIFGSTFIPGGYLSIGLLRSH